MVMSKIQEIVVQKGLKPNDCEYHTIRVFDDGTKVRAMVIKGDDTLHLEYTCAKCGHSDYTTQKYAKVSKAAKIRFSVVCSKCGNKINIEKLKAKKKEKK
jgi:RNase P subunit RPR2